jgi:uncharacterized repeat protein (TIGR03803 family)
MARLQFQCSVLLAASRSVLVSALIHLPHSAYAQTLTTLYRFTDLGDGSTPYAGVLYVDGMLYGTAAGGNARRCDCGTMFKVDPTSGKETVLFRSGYHSRAGGPFYHGLTYANGELYGSAYYAGENAGFGTIFAFDLKARKMRVLYNLSGGSMGANVNTDLVYRNGYLYGTTEDGGTDYFGVAFKLDIRTRTWKILYNFGIGSYNQGISEQNGMLVGSEQYGGGLGPPLCKIGCGVVFSIDPDSGAYTQLAAFRGGNDGAYPNIPLFLDGAFYGSTKIGGDGCHGNGCGTVYKLAAHRNGDFHDRTLYRFKPVADARFPNGPLVYHNGAFYGETGAQGEKHGCFGDGGGCGTIFKIDRATHAETILYRFTGGDDGGIPNGGLTYHDGALYGTTQLGGNRPHCRPYGCGTAFKLMLNEPK